MPKYRITDPNGKTFEITAPDGATKEQALAYAQQQFSAAPVQSAQDQYDPTEGMSTTGKLIAGYGSAIPRMVRGVGQRLGLVSQAEVDEANRLDAPLLRTGAGSVGNIAGSVMAAVPTMAIPGAASIPGAAVIGAAQGLTTPTSTGESAVQNAAIGGVAGPIAIGAGRAIMGGIQGSRALAEPFTQAGRERIAGRTLERFADDPAKILALRGGASSTGAIPTIAEESRDPGLARLQDALRSVDPKIASRIDARLAENNAARVNTLRNIAGTPAEREAAVSAVERQARQLYGQAFKEDLAVTPELQRLINRPSVRKAEARAAQLSQETGAPFSTNLDDAFPRTVYAGQRSIPDSSVATTVSQRNPLTLTTHNVPVDLPVSSGRAANYVEIPPVESFPVGDMHTLKMGMDALLTDPTLGIAGREAKAVMATRNRLLDLLPESYQTARQGHIQMNRPVNQMDIGGRLLQNFSSATDDLSGNPRLRAEAFNRALQNEGQLIKQATGVKGIKSLADVMEPTQLASIRGVADELGVTAAVAREGNGPGSATAQRLASQNILRQLIGPTGLPSSWAESAIANTVVGKPLNLVYGGVAEPRIQNALADALLDPAVAQAALRGSGFGSSAAQSNRLLNLLRQSGRVAPSTLAISNDR